MVMCSPGRTQASAVDIEELAPRRAGAQDHDALRAGHLVEAPDQGGDDVAQFRVIIVAGTLETSASRG
jgi:hypothetical protein